MSRLPLAFLLLASASTLHAAPPPGNSAPAATAPFTDTIPPAKDQPYPGGTLAIAVDATDITRGIFRVKETVPVAGPGDLVLLLPKWLPGNHGPSGPIDKIAGLRVSANGRTLNWVRDPVDVYGFHIDVPAGVKTIDAEFQFVSPTAANQGRVVMTPSMLNLQWTSVALYPAGWYTRQISITPSVTYPAGWQAATALRGTRSGDTIRYATVDFDTLIDSPIMAGRYYRAEALSPDVKLNIFGDKPANLVIKPEQLAAHRNLVTQAVKLYGAQHYDHYDFLFALSERQSGIGLEHHRSSEDGVGADYFTDWDGNVRARDLLPHEYTHSWDGKFRRGADLWTPDYRTPMRDSMLWVYEGQTQFWGHVLAARSGLVTRAEALDNLANDAATYGDATPGRQWRPVIDTTNDPIVSGRAPQAWRGWSRSEDYYVEGALVWLEADGIIRQQTGGKKGMDDFARAFFGVRDRDWGELTYDFNTVVETLNGITPYDWARFLNERIYAVRPTGATAGLAKGGYELVYTDQPNLIVKGGEKAAKGTSLTWSGGLSIDKEGKLSSVIWDSPAFDAGLAVGMKIVAVNGLAYDGDTIKAAITDAKGGRTPIQLIVQSGDTFRTVPLAYFGGLRYPHLHKTGSGTASIDTLFTAK